MFTTVIKFLWYKVLSVSSPVRKIYFHLFRTPLSVQLFTADALIGVEGLQNAISWKVAGAHQITLNGKQVHPVSGQYSFISGATQKFELRCYGINQEVVKELVVTAHSYKARRSFVFKQFARAPLFRLEKLTPIPFRAINNPKLDSIGFLQATKATDRLNETANNLALERLSTDAALNQMHQKLHRCRAELDGKFAQLNHQLFPKGVVPENPKQTIDNLFKNPNSTK